MADEQRIQNTDDFEQSLKLAKTLLKYVGLRPIYGPKTTNFVSWLRENWFFFFSFFQLFFTVVGETIFTIQAFGRSVQEATAVLPCLCFCYVAITKMISLFTRRYIVRDVLTQIQDLWLRKQFSEKEKVIKKQFLRTLSQTTQSSFYMLISQIKIFNLTPCFVMTFDYISTGTFERSLPYFVWYPFDPLSPKIYVIVYLYQYWSGIVSALGIIGSDCLFQTSCSHICMLVNILQEEIRNVIPITEEIREGENLEDEVCKKKLISILYRHKILIGICDDLEVIYNIDIFVNVMSISIITCCVGFQIIINDAKEFAKYFVSLSSLLLHTLILTYYGNKIIDTTAGVADAAYECRWYLAGPQFKVILLTLMMRAQKPLSLTALKFSTFSLMTFTGILGKSWSYFTLLRTIYDSNKE